MTCYTRVEEALKKVDGSQYMTDIETIELSKFISKNRENIKSYFYVEDFADESSISCYRAFSILLLAHQAGIFDSRDTDDGVPMFKLFYV